MPQVSRKEALEKIRAELMTIQEQALIMEDLAKKRLREIEREQMQFEIEEFMQNNQLNQKEVKK